MFAMVLSLLLKVCYDRGLLQSVAHEEGAIVSAYSNLLEFILNSLNKEFRYNRQPPPPHLCGFEMQI